MNTFYNTLFSGMESSLIHKNCYKKMIIRSKKVLDNTSDTSLLFDATELMDKINNIDNYEHKRCLIEIVNYYNEYNIPFLQKNLETLRIENSSLAFISHITSTNISGIYNNKKNLIKYDGSIYTLYHELLHASSSSNNYSGFCCNKNNIGAALNEGATELLASNIYKGSDVSTGYDIEKKVAQMIQTLIGKDITQYYFDASVEKLYTSLEQKVWYLLSDIIAALDLYALSCDYNKNKYFYLKCLYYINYINEAYMCLLINKYKDGYNKDILLKLQNNYDNIVNSYDNTTMYTESEYEDLSKLILRKYKR